MFDKFNMAHSALAAANLTFTAAQHLVKEGSQPHFAFAETLDGAPAAKPSLVFRL